MTLLPNFPCANRGQRDLIQNPKELFNLRHSSCRMIVERVFGVLKSRFPVLEKPLSQSISFQKDLLPGLCALHNYLRQHNDEGIEQRLIDKVDRVLNREAHSAMSSSYPGGRQRRGDEQDDDPADEVEGDGLRGLPQYQSLARQRQQLVDARDRMAGGMWAQHQANARAGRARRD